MKKGEPIRLLPLIIKYEDDDAAMVNEKNGHDIRHDFYYAAMILGLKFRYLKFTPISNKAPGRKGGIVCVCVPHVDIFDPALLDIKNCSINRFVDAARAAFGESTSQLQ